jgi:predicted RNase H-like HicB family nuclease
MKKGKILSMSERTEHIYTIRKIFITAKKELPMKYRVLIEQDEDGMYIAECPTLPGCISQGKTREEALLNIQDAIKGYLKSLEKHSEPIPPPIEEEIVEVTF